MTRQILALAIAAVCLAGCGKNADPSVRGTVTWNGQPVEKGYITFFPISGPDAVRGAEINSGEFHVLNLTPGKRRASITVLPQIQAHEKPEGVVLQFTPTRDRLTSHSAGNNQIVEIGVGAQVMDFTLRTAAR